MKAKMLFPVIALITTLVFWSSSYVFIKIAIRDFTPGALGLFRYGIAAFLMAIVYFFTPNKTKISLKDGIQIFLTGAIGMGFYNFCINKGEMTVIAALASFFIALVPVFTSIASRWLFNDRLSFLGNIGIIFGLSGVALISYSEYTGHASFGVGLAFLLMASLSGAFYSLMTKRLIHKFGPVELSSLSIISAAIVQLFYLFPLLREFPHAHWPEIASVIYLGVCPAATAYLLYSYVLTRLSVVSASSTMLLMPFVTLVIAWFVLGEKLSSLGFLGGCVIFAGLLMIRSCRKKCKIPPQTS